MRQSTGWIIIVVLCASFVLLLTRVGAEVNEVETLSEAFDTNIELGELFLSSNSYILDSEGRLVSEIYKDTNRVYKPFDQINPLFIDSFVSTEDRRFYEHEGYDTAGIARAFVANTSSSETEQGGSTITQQLVRNIYLSHEQTYQRKLSEILYSRELEKRYTKDDILELYLNSIFLVIRPMALKQQANIILVKAAMTSPLHRLLLSQPFLTTQASTIQLIIRIGQKRENNGY